MSDSEEFEYRRRDEEPVHPALAGQAEDDDLVDTEPQSPAERAASHRDDLMELLEQNDPANPHTLIGVIGHGLLMIEGQLARIARSMESMQTDLERIRRSSR